MPVIAISLPLDLINILQNHKKYGYKDKSKMVQDALRKIVKAT